MDRLSALKVFITIVEQGSLSGAAKLLDIERTKVSRYLSELEDWVGTRLLHRTTRNQSLTQAGEKTLQRAYQIDFLTGDINTIIDRQNDTLSGRLRITSSYAMVDVFLLEAINEFCTLWPQVQIELIVADKHINLIEDGIDLAVRISNDLDPNIVAKKIGICRSVIVASPQYLLANEVEITTPKSLIEHNCLSFSYFGKHEWSFYRENENENVAISGRLIANNSNILLKATLDGAGISYQPLACAWPLIQSGKLVQLLTDWEAKNLDVHLVYSNRKQMTLLHRRFIDFVSNKMSLNSLWN
ncbi:HTH-type transcriptional regulator, LysR-family [Aliivibrio wodanis]|uniref:HTH-type transcriptional regulator, LysR-family n=1 Tax=Aliivibrio wodanis TaxID=80852 RepID=A0A090IS06_9GAMM|nr:HTH-type transcriptional regulator, LysR-family [Aliivibrio wodanis]